jgi:hypothetical protein
MERADEPLYSAKRAGRNRIELAPDQAEFVRTRGDPPFAVWWSEGFSHTFG